MRLSFVNRIFKYIAFDPILETVGCFKQIRVQWKLCVLCDKLCALCEKDFLHRDQIAPQTQSSQ